MSFGEDCAEAAELEARPGDEGEHTSVVEGALKLGEAAVHSCENTDIDMLVAAVHLDRNGILKMVLKMAVKRQRLALLKHRKITCLF